MANPEGGARLYPTADLARQAVADAARAEGHEPHEHTWLGAICDEAECSCGIRMPLTTDGHPALTFEEWVEYHDRVLLERVATTEPGAGSTSRASDDWATDGTLTREETLTRFRALNPQPTCGPHDRAPAPGGLDE